MRFLSFFNQSAVLGAANESSFAAEEGSSFDLKGERDFLSLRSLRCNPCTGTECFRADLEVEEHSAPLTDFVEGELQDVTGTSERLFSLGSLSECLRVRKSVSRTTFSGMLVCRFDNTLEAGAPLARARFFRHGLTHPSSKGPLSDAERISSGLP
jgi:hypothetical protein